MSSYKYTWSNKKMANYTPQNTKTQENFSAFSI